MWRFPQLRSPLVSVVICVHDGERFLAEAIDSVLEQTHRPIEVLLVDDGSSDGSPAIAAAYAARHAFIRCMGHEGRANRGAGASRNLGLRHCRGTYVGFLDADDVWLPGKLEVEVALLRAHPRAAMVCSNTLIWNSWTTDPLEISQLARRPELTDGRPVDTMRRMGRGRWEGMIRGHRLLGLHLRNKRGLPTMIGALIRRGAALRVGGFEEAFPNLYEDQVFFSKIAARERVYVTQQCFARYRQHGASMCNRARRSVISQSHLDEMAATHRRFLRWLEDYLPGDDRRFTPIRRMIHAQLEEAKAEGAAGG